MCNNVHLGGRGLFTRAPFFFSYGSVKDGPISEVCESHTVRKHRTHADPPCPAFHPRLMSQLSGEGGGSGFLVLSGDEIPLQESLKHLSSEREELTL